MGKVIEIRKEKPKRSIRRATNEDTMTLQQYLNGLVAREIIDRNEAELIAKAVAEMGQIVETVSLGATHMVDQDIKELSQEKAEEEVQRIDMEEIRKHGVTIKTRKTASRTLSNKSIIAKEEIEFWIDRKAELDSSYNFTKAHQNFTVAALDDPERSVIPMTKGIEKLLERTQLSYVPTKLSNAEVHFLLFLRICRYELGRKRKDQG
jgi:hypothetical protein